MLAREAREALAASAAVAVAATIVVASGMAAVAASSAAVAAAAPVSPDPAASAASAVVVAAALCATYVRWAAQVCLVAESGANWQPSDNNGGGGGGGGAGFGGAIFVQQGGTLVVSGPLAVNGNSVSGGAGGASGGGNAVSGGNGSAFGNGIFLQGNGTLSFKPGSGNTQTISDVIADQTGSGDTSFNSGSWAMTVSGGGTLVLNGSNTYSGGTTVTGATLVVNGLIDDPTINSAGVLMGTGTVGPTQVNSGGTFAPGNGTPGSSMTVAGNLAFASGALYVVNLNPTMSSFASEMGTATLAGTVQANFSPGSYVAKQYTILTATGGIYGTFSGISNVNLPANASDSLSYGANAVFLNLLPGFASLTGLNQNQQDVAKALINSFNMTGGLLAQFFGLSPMGLTQSTGEVATGAERAAMQLTNEFLELMLDPFVHGRGNAGGLGGGAIGFAPDEQADLPPEIALAYASIVTKAPPKPIFDQRWTAWGSAFGGSNQANGVPAVGSNSVAASTFGFAGGMDYHVISPSTVVGFALAGAGTSWGRSQRRSAAAVAMRSRSAVMAFLGSVRPMWPVRSPSPIIGSPPTVQRSAMG